MESYLNDINHVAIHEAGHAVIGRRLGLGCGPVTIKPDENEGAAGICFTEDPYDTQVTWWERDRYRKFGTVLLGRALMQMAGAEAEAECLGHCEGGDDDDRYRIACILDDIGPAEAEAFHRFEARLRQWTRTLVRRHRPAIEKVAAELIARETLTRRKVDRLIGHDGWFRDRRPQEGQRRGRVCVPGEAGV